MRCLFLKYDFKNIFFLFHFSLHNISYINEHYLDLYGTGYTGGNSTIFELVPVTNSSKEKGVSILYCMRMFYISDYG